MKRTTIWRECFQQQRMQPRAACTNFHSIADLVSSHKPEVVKQSLAPFSHGRDESDEDETRASSPEEGDECESRRRRHEQQSGSPSFHHDHRRDSGSPGSQSGANDTSPVRSEENPNNDLNSLSPISDDSPTVAGHCTDAQNTSTDQVPSEPPTTPEPLNNSRENSTPSPRPHQVTREVKEKAKLDESLDGGRGRKGRTIYKAQQVYVLEQIFSRTHYPDPEVIETLSKDLDISENKIKVWFQNKRARWRRRAAETGQHPPSALPPSMLMMPNSPAAAAAANATAAAAAAAGLLPWSPHSAHPLLMPHHMFHPGYHPQRHVTVPHMTSHNISMTSSPMTSPSLTHSHGLSPLHASVEARSTTIKAPLPTYGLPLPMMPFWHDTHKINVT